MCGIAGFLLRKGSAEPASVKAMCDPIRHRGPDDEGVYTDGGCGIGMRRLSIIDLGTGHQPISNEDGPCGWSSTAKSTITRSCATICIRRGHRFATNSDTETLVHLYEEKGAEGFALLRGMFAFCDLGRAAAQDPAGSRPFRQEAAVLCADALRVCISEAS